ncbi:hypothetical protein B0A52_06078 [Exophiala mesophila]|uniref:Ribosomal protein L21 n=1 Tax=Exophiala mesophila TaxID=212818 RepID=A0A438N5L0_EXOME|nr:hypothetical protein B0A52_06078 [Exophiala mesophila]
MCRICGRMVKCIFDSMPSRVPKIPASTRSRSVYPPRHIRSHHVSSRALVRSALDLTSTTRTIQPPTFLLPFRAKKFHSATTTGQQSVSSKQQFQNTSPEIPPTVLQTTNQSTINPVPTAQREVASGGTAKSGTLTRPLVLSKTLQEMLPQLHAQKPHYITAHIHRFPYLLTEGDTLRLPFLMKDVFPGDILRLNRASIIGSRDFTLKAGMSNTETYDSKRTGEPNYLDERLFELRMRVMGTETGPMMDKEKKKRRNRHRRVIHSKHRYTVLRVMQLRVKGLDELKSEKGTLLLES